MTIFMEDLHKTVTAYLENQRNPDVCANSEVYSDQYPQLRI